MHFGSQISCCSNLIVLIYCTNSFGAHSDSEYHFFNRLKVKEMSAIKMTSSRKNDYEVIK